LGEHEKNRAELISFRTCLAAGDLDEEENPNTLQTLKPEQVLFGLFQFNELNKYLVEKFDLILERDNKKTRLYIRKDLRN
jgi:hypothetical protein